MLKKDKQKVLGEVFDDERVRSFLDFEPYGETDANFQILERAYRGMKPENFNTFVAFYSESGRDINCKNLDGKTFYQVIKHHRHGEEYLGSLKQAGAE